MTENVSIGSSMPDGDIFPCKFTDTLVAASSDGSAWPIKHMLRLYVTALHSRPLCVKAATSSSIALLADLTAQTLNRTEAVRIRSSLNYALLGGLLTAPLTHWFQEWLDRLLPPLIGVSLWRRLCRLLTRTLCDRLIFGAPFLLASLYLLNRLEGRSHQAASRLVSLGFWPMFCANVRFWLPLQLINVNLVPRIYRVLVANLCAFGWILILAKKRRTLRSQPKKCADSSDNRESPDSR